MDTQPGKIVKPFMVLDVSQRVREADAGGVEKYYRIQYKTKGGVVDFANFSEDEYTEENVVATLTKLAQKHDKIRAL